MGIFPVTYAITLTRHCRRVCDALGVLKLVRWAGAGFLVASSTVLFKARITFRLQPGGSFVLPWSQLEEGGRYNKNTKRSCDQVRWLCSMRT